MSYKRVPHQGRASQRDVAGRPHPPQDHYMRPPRIWHDTPHRAAPARPVQHARRLLTSHHRMESAQQYGNQRRHIALSASGCNDATCQHKPQLLRDNSSRYIADDRAEYICTQKLSHVRGAPMHPQTQRQDQTLARDIQEALLIGKLLAARQNFSLHFLQSHNG